MRTDLTPIQLPLLLDPALDARVFSHCGDLAPLLISAWAAGERLVRHGDREIFAGVWIHLEGDGSARLRVRGGDYRLLADTSGGWYTEGRVLVARFGHRVIRAPFEVRDDLLFWAGETLIRMPDDPPGER